VYDIVCVYLWLKEMYENLVLVVAHECAHSERTLLFRSGNQCVECMYVRYIVKMILRGKSCRFASVLSISLEL
jgi:hypothetical protein